MSEVEPRNISALGDNDGDETTLEPGPGKERESEEEDPIDFVHRLVKESQSYWDMEQDSHPGYHSFGRPPENVIHSKEDRERLYALLKRGSLCNLSRKDRISAYLVFLQVSGRPLEQSRTVRTSLPPGARRWWRPTMMKEKAGMSSHVLGVLGGPLSTEKVEVLQRVLFSICDRFPSVVAATSFSFPQFIMKLFDDMEERNVIGLVTGFLEDNLMSECFFGHSPTQLHGTLSVIMQLVRKQVPALEGTLNYIGVHFSLILEPWIDTLFSQMIVALLRHVAVEFEGAKRQQLEECINAFWWRILDVIVCDGVSGPFKVAVSLIITLSDDLFRCESPENAMQSIVYGLLKIVIPPGDEIPSLNSKWEETIGSLEISGEELHLMVLRSMERFSVFRLPIMDPHVLRRDMYALSEEVMFSYYELMQLVQDIRMLHPYGGVDWEGFASIIENARGKVSTPVTLLKKMFRAFLRIQSVIVYDPAAVDSVVADILSAGRSMDHTNGWQTDEEEHMKGSSRHASMISTFTGTSDDSGEASIRDQDMESIIETSTMDGKSPARSQSTIDMSRTRAKELDGSLMRFPIDDIRLVSPSLPTEKIKLDHHAAIVGLSLMWNGSLDQKVDFLLRFFDSDGDQRLTHAEVFALHRLVYGSYFSFMANIELQPELDDLLSITSVYFKQQKDFEDDDPIYDFDRLRTLILIQPGVATLLHGFSDDVGRLAMQPDFSRDPFKRNSSIWIKNENVVACQQCGSRFSMTRRRHHCRSCGGVYCKNCLSQKFRLSGADATRTARLCDVCRMGWSSHLEQGVTEAGGDLSFDIGDDIDD